MKKVGILFGQEDTFPHAFIDRVNARKVDGVVAEPVRIDKVIQGEPSGYDVIIDRISQDVPFYRAYLKNAALNGTAVVNNPFWWSADEKFFNNCLATKIGVAVPKTVLLPSHEPPPDTSDEVVPQPGLSAGLGRDLRLRRLAGLLQAVRRRRLEERLPGGEPGPVLPRLQRDRPARHDAPGGDRLQRVLPLLLPSTAVTSTSCSTTPAAVPPALREGTARRSIPALLQKVHDDVLALNQWLGYDFNTVEFAVRDGIPLAIDFCNPAPDADVNSIGQDNFDWIVEAAADMAIRKAQAHVDGRDNLRWGQYVGGPRRRRCRP